MDFFKDFVFGVTVGVGSAALYLTILFVLIWSIYWILNSIK
jgi:hypothetical protein